MSMYVLQVLTGKETEIRDCLQDIGIEAHVPQERYIIRSHGRWTEHLKVLIPSYVFVALDQVAEDYYRIRQITGIIRFLELYNGGSAALTRPEEKFIRSICHGDRPAPVSNVRIDGDKIIPLDGPLKIYSDAGYRIKYNRHHRKAQIFTLDSISKEINLSFNIKSNIKSPTTPRG